MSPDSNQVTGEYPIKVEITDGIHTTSYQFTITVQANLLTTTNTTKN